MYVLFAFYDRAFNNNKLIRIETITSLCKKKKKKSTSNPHFTSFFGAHMATGNGSGAKGPIPDLPCVCRGMNLYLKDKPSVLFTQSALCSFSPGFVLQHL